jgi:hypothetical protein
MRITERWSKAQRWFLLLIWLLGRGLVKIGLSA